MPLPPLAKKRTPFRLCWVDPKGQFTGACFDTPQEAEVFANALLKAGLSPWAPSDAITIYDSAQGSA